MESNTEPSLNYNKHYSTMPINIAFTHDMHVSITKNIFIALQLMLLYFTIPDQAAVMEKLHWSSREECVCWPCEWEERKSLWF